MYTTKQSLLKRMQKCDEISWDEFYSIYWSLVLDIGRKLGMTEDDCRDLMQEIMYDLFKGEALLHYDAARGKFRTFFGVLVRHKASDMLRDSARFSSIPGTDGGESGDASETDGALSALLNPSGDNGSDPFQALFDAEYRSCLLSMAVNELRNSIEPKTYAIFEMVVLQERSPKEVASNLGISRSVIDVYCSRCRKALRKIVSEIRVDNPDFNPDFLT